MSDSLQPLWTVACQAPLTMGFSRQEYWSRLPCPPPEDLPDPGIKPTSSVAPALQADSLPLTHLGSPKDLLYTNYQKNANQNYIEVSLHTSQNSHHPKNPQIISAIERVWGKGTSPTQLMGM